MDTGIVDRAAFSRRSPGSAPVNPYRRSPVLRVEVRVPFPLPTTHDGCDNAPTLSTIVETGIYVERSTTERLVRKAVHTIRVKYEEPLSLEDLARVAVMSKFYFLRTFRGVTGVTPVRFLSAVRIHEAKRLLSTTSMSVARVSSQVGYGSLGTFSRRFAECVGLPPSVYRQVARGEAEYPSAAGTVARGGTGALCGTVDTPHEVCGPVVIGLFPGPVPYGRPAATAQCEQPGQWRLPVVPAGSWHLLAAARAAAGGDTLLTGVSGPVRVLPGHIQHRGGITLRPVGWASPPLLAALPGLDVGRALTAP